MPRGPPATTGRSKIIVDGDAHVPPVSDKLLADDAGLRFDMPRPIGGRCRDTLNMARRIISGRDERARYIATPCALSQRRRRPRCASGRHFGSEKTPSFVLLSPCSIDFLMPRFRLMRRRSFRRTPAQSSASRRLSMLSARSTRFRLLLSLLGRKYRTMIVGTDLGARRFMRQVASARRVARPRARSSGERGVPGRRRRQRRFSTPSLPAANASATARGMPRPPHFGQAMRFTDRSFSPADDGGLSPPASPAVNIGFSRHWLGTYGDSSVIIRSLSVDL